MKKINYINIMLPVLIFLLFWGLLFFIINSLNVVSETNQNNFSYTVKTRDALEKVDAMVMKAELNANLLSAAISTSYDINKLNNLEYNLNFLRKVNLLSKAVLINNQMDGVVWFHLNNDVPFSNKIYSWYQLKDGNFIDLKTKLGKDSLSLNENDDKYYFDAIKAQKKVWSKLYLDKETDTQMLTLAEPIYKHNVLIGVVGIDIPVNRIQQILKNMQSVFDHSEVFLVDADNNIVLKQLDPTSQSHTKKSTFLNLFDKRLRNEIEMTEFLENGVRKTAIMLLVSKEYNIVITFPNMLIFRGFDCLFKIIYFIFAIFVALTAIIILNRKKIIEMNKELKTETSKLRTIIDSSPSFILIKDLNGVYTDCNNKALELWGLDKDELIGKTDCDLMEGAEENLVMETKKMTVNECIFVTKNGKKIYVEKYVLPLFNEDNELIGLLINAFDITKRKEEQKILKKAKEAAEEAAVMKSNFLANMSHEIRTPMNGLSGFIQLLQDTNLREDQAEYVANAQKSSELLLDVINDILDFSKLEAEKLHIDNVSFDIHSVVEDVTLMATSNAAAKGLNVNSLICSDVPTNVFGDPGRIKQILNNLVNNAIKFTKEGEVSIYVKQISEDDENTVLSFEVKDTGIGIMKDKLSLIFEAFTQADYSMTRNYGGTGLGLAISKKLVDLMNGTITVKSSVDKGSTFTFTLPLKIDKTQEQDHIKSVSLLNDTKILIVDDNPSDVKIIKYYLNEANCVCYDASTSDEALSIINQPGIEISAILIDHKMQNSNGKELSSLIIQNDKSKDTPLILYTSLAKRGDAASVKEKGFSGVLIKPIKKNELIETIAAALNSKKDSKNKKFITKNLVSEHEFKDNANILVVEDSEINCKLILKILSIHGLSCDLAVNGQEAIESFKANKYDLILMDCQIPIIDGYQATQEIRKLEGEGEHVPIIAMTANALAKDQEKCFSIGMDDYISKPLNLNELLNKMSKYLTLEGDKSKETEAFKLKGYDDYIKNIVNEMMTELGFSQSDAIQLFIDFIEYLPNSISELEKGVSENNYDELKKLAHKLKGASANLRIETITQHSINLEEAAQNQDNNKCIEIISQIKNHLEYLNALFLKYMSFQ